MSRPGAISRAVVLAALVLTFAPPPAAAAPEGTLTFALHFAPVPRWLDPAEGESTITPFLILYALHDALLYHLGFPTGLGPRVEDILTTAIPGFYLSPYEDLALKRQ